MEEVKRQPFVQEVKTVMGPYDLAFSGSFKDVNELNRFVQLLEAKEYFEECVVNPTFNRWEGNTTEEKPIVAWSLIQATHPSEVQEKLERVEGVPRIYTTAGEHNLVAELGFDAIEEMKDRTKDIHEIPGIKRRGTLPGFTEYTNGTGL